MIKRRSIGVAEYIFIAVFGIVGVFLTFFVSDTSKYDSQTTAYKIDANEKSDDDGTSYYPRYYFKVNGEDYVCVSNTGSSFLPKEGKNKVYYDSKNPKNCKTQYEKSTSSIGGIICLIVAGIMAIFLIRKSSNARNEANYLEDININEQNIDAVAQQMVDTVTQNMNNEGVQDIVSAVEKIQLIVKRIVLGIIIFILFVMILFDIGIIKQTIKAKDYIDVTANLVDKKDDDSNIFDDYIYTFEDTNGKQQEIIVSISDNETVKQEMKIKYDKNNPQEYFYDGQTLDKVGIILFIVKIIIIILLIVLFFNKKLLSKIYLSTNIN